MNASPEPGFAPGSGLVTALATVIAAFYLAMSPLSPTRASAQQVPDVLFREDFEAGLGAWTFPLGSGHALVETGDPGRGSALALRTVSLPVYALVDGSEMWGDVRIEGEVLFPDEGDSYLGFIFRYADDGRRIDFGSLYIKGNGSYVQANPHHDTNVGRTVFPEMRASLEGREAIRVGEWKPFALEVIGNEAHLYVGEGDTPAMTFTSPGPSRGAFGFKPRNPGEAVWIDNVTVRSIDRFGYDGPPRPDVPYRKERHLTGWEVLGPLTRTAPHVEAGGAALEPGWSVRDDGRRVGWRPLPTDPRGAVLTGWITEHRGARKVAYFRAPIIVDRPTTGELHFSSADDLAIWLNGEFLGFGSRGRAAWWDAGDNPDYPPLRAPVRLRPGRNELVVRVVGGTYATGGFFVRLEAASGPDSSH